MAKHIARHDPARVLAECAAKRRIVVNLEEFRGESSWDDEKNVNGLYLLRLLALPYADHPAYREDWRP